MGFQNDRRHSTRFAGDDYPLRLGQRAARLADWSAGGVGVRVKDGTDGLRVGDPVTISIHSERTNGVALFTGRVIHVDPARRLVGVGLFDGGPDAARLLVDLVGQADADGSGTGAGTPR